MSSRFADDSSRVESRAAAFELWNPLAGRLRHATVIAACGDLAESVRGLVGAEVRVVVAPGRARLGWWRVLVDQEATRSGLSPRDAGTPR